ncbi:DUF4124 domain-containing protein [Stenotrophomonas maltophilia]|uniref:DUF4124 domain-containing protein n=1 Tax=Stenotrophomonas maltophilia TaxID=40324 RepID=UPI0034DAFD42
MNSTSAIALALLLATPLASAQVYKCKGASGETTYSQNPCGSEAVPMKLRSNRAASETAGEAANRSAVYRTAELNDAGFAERNCLQREQSRIYGPLESRSQAVNRQVADLNRQLAGANSTLAGATAESGIRAQISSLQQALSSERISADSQMTAARDRCSTARRERENAVRDKYPGTSAPAH